MMDQKRSKIGPVVSYCSQRLLESVVGLLSISSTLTWGFENLGFFRIWGGSMVRGLNVAHYLVD